MPSYFIEIEGCQGCADYEYSWCERANRDVSGVKVVPDWCPRNAKPAEYIQKLEKQQAEQKSYDELKVLYLDALEGNDLLEGQLRTLEEEYRQVLAKLPKGD